MSRETKLTIEELLSAEDIDEAIAKNLESGAALVALWGLERLARCWNRRSAINALIRALMAMKESLNECADNVNRAQNNVERNALKARVFGA